MRAYAPARMAASGRCWELPGESKWHRTWRVLLLLSVAQMITSIYVWFGLRSPMFFGFYLAYAFVAAVLMLLRAKWGLLWFGAGSLLYCTWLSVLCWRSLFARDWERMCLDFALAALELLMLCLTVGHFRELGGLASCCGAPPDSKRWKGVILMGGAAPAELLDGGDATERSVQGRGAMYVPPVPPFARQISLDGSSDGSRSGDQLSESDASRISSASSSYNAASIGRGYLAFPGQNLPSRSASFYHPTSEQMKQQQLLIEQQLAQGTLFLEQPQHAHEEPQAPLQPSPSDAIFGSSPPRSESFYEMPAAAAAAAAAEQQGALLFARDADMG